MEQGVRNLTGGRMVSYCISQSKQVTRQEIVTLSFSWRKPEAIHSYLLLHLCFTFASVREPVQQPFQTFTEWI